MNKWQDTKRCRNLSLTTNLSIRYVDPSLSFLLFWSICSFMYVICTFFFLFVCQFFTYCHHCISFTYDNVLSIRQIFLIHFFNKLGEWTWKINYSSRLHGIHDQNFQQQFAIHYHIHDQNIFCSTVLCNACHEAKVEK